MRQRTIFVGVRDDLEIEPVHPSPLPYRYTVRDALPWIVQVKMGGKPLDNQEASRPSPTIMQTDANRSESAYLSGGGWVEAETDISKYAIGKEWDNMSQGESPLPGWMTDSSDLVVGAVQLGVLRDTPAVRSFLEYWLTPEPQRIWVGLGGHLSPYGDIEITDYPDRWGQTEAEILKTAKTLKFDASDAMPSAVGTGSFWAGIVDYLSGVDLKTVLEDIEASWIPNF